MNGGDGAERDGAAGAEEEAEEEMEGGGEDEVESYGGEEEGPCGSPRMAVAPPESDDRWVLRQPVGQILDRHDSDGESPPTVTEKRSIGVKIVGRQPECGFGELGEKFPWENLKLVNKSKWGKQFLSVGGPFL